MGAADGTVIDGCVVPYQPVLNLHLRLTQDPNGLRRFVHVVTPPICEFLPYRQEATDP